MTRIRCRNILIKSAMTEFIKRADHKNGSALGALLLDVSERARRAVSGNHSLNTPVPDRLTSYGGGYALSFYASSDRLSDDPCLDGDWP
ncbi:MAG: hypothetical protein WCJ40_17950 [Planctomycetota bacterium]